jgi:NAD(P)-dependent dehydrogenase (short-subunit alcohol dehydrogenase family)/uncharacterized OB-fold protein
VISLPPAVRSRVGLGLTAAAALGRFELQICRECGAVQYPPREACMRCLSLRLEWTSQSGDGELLAETTLQHSHNEFFRERLPWRLGLVRLDCGVTVVANLHGDVAQAGARVRVVARLDRAGQAALIALPLHEVNSMVDDKQSREMTCDPRGRTALVTDAKSAVGTALVRALLAAGAARIWAGCADAAGCAQLERLEKVALLRLDVASAESVKRAAAEVGAEVDILVNNAEHPGTYGIGPSQGIDGARAEMEVNYFGLLRLANEFGPGMRARAGESAAGVMAWVNVLSVYALSNYPALGTFSASKAAACSLAQCQRAQMQTAGIRVINVFPGPIDDPSQAQPPPKLSAEALARGIVKGLQDGVEDLYPGDVAQEWLARWRDNPKVLERELAMVAP